MDDGDPWHNDTVTSDRAKGPWCEEGTEWTGAS